MLFRSLRERDGAVAAACFAGRVLGTISVILIAGSALIGFLAAPAAMAVYKMKGLGL